MTNAEESGTVSILLCPLSPDVDASAEMHHTTGTTSISK